jgi:hypothetical protein
MNGLSVGDKHLTFEEIYHNHICRYIDWNKFNKLVDEFLEAE